MSGNYKQYITKSLILSLLISFSGCSPQQNQNNSSPPPIINKLPVTNITQIKFGYSAGECAGYCWQEMSVMPENITLKKKSFTDDKKQYPDFNKALPFSLAEWNNLINIINLDKINSLPDRIGVVLIVLMVELNGLL